MNIEAEEQAEDFEVGLGGEGVEDSTHNAFFLAANKGRRKAATASKKFAREIKTECLDIFQCREVIEYFKVNWANFIHVPYLPAFHRPGWLLRYMLGPPSPSPSPPRHHHHRHHHPLHQLYILFIRSIHLGAI